MGDGKEANETCCCCTKRNCCIISLISFIFLTIAGILMLALIPFLIHQVIEKDITLRAPDSSLYQNFHNLTKQGVDIKNVYHFFHLKNRDAVEHHGAKPDLELKGPYTYLHMKVRPEEHIRWYPNGTLGYKDIVHNFFLPDESKGTEQDMIVTPKLGVMMAMQQSKGNGIFEDLVYDAMEKATPKFNTFFQERSVFDLVHGYEEPVLVELASELKWLGVKVDPVVAFDPNVTTPGGQMAIYSGGPASKTQPAVPDGYKSFAQYTMVNGESKLSWWNSTAANTIRGTDATMYPALYMLDQSRELEAYVSAIKRSVTLNFRHSHRDLGIPIYRYRLGDSMFKSLKTVPSNGDYFIYHEGLQPMTPCKGVPADFIFAAISKPFYLDILDMTGINVTLPRAPNRDLDDVVLDYEPLTSTLVEGHERLQLNVKIGPIALTSKKDKMDHLVNCSKHLPSTWMPIFKFDKMAVLPKKDQDKLKAIVAVLLAMLVVGIIFVIIGTFGGIYATYKVCTLPAGGYGPEGDGLLGSGVQNRSMGVRDTDVYREGGQVNYNSSNNHHDV